MKERDGENLYVLHVHVSNCRGSNYVLSDGSIPFQVTWARCMGFSGVTLEPTMWTCTQTTVGRGWTS